MEPTAWVRYAWSILSLWHDAGYDAATLYLLTTREFSHLRLTERLMPSAQSVVRGAIESVVAELSNDLPGGFKRDLGADVLDDAPGAYALSWLVDGWGVPSASSYRGRWHAILSAYEFLAVLSEVSAERRECFMPLAVAIAQHHEREGYAAGWPVDAQAGEVPASDAALARDLVQSPFGVLLRFIDSFGGFPRVSLKWPAATPANGTTPGIATGHAIAFTVDVDHPPITIDATSGSRPVFYRGTPTGRLVTIRQTLWGTTKREVQRSVLQSVAAAAEASTRPASVFH